MVSSDEQQFPASIHREIAGVPARQRTGFQRRKWCDFGGERAHKKRPEDVETLTSV
jgi:hypothetical protein